MDEYNPVNIMSDIMADDLWVGGSDANDNANWHRMMNFEARPNAVIAGLWTDAYSGVKRCNDVLAYIEKEIAGMTPRRKHIMKLRPVCSVCIITTGFGSSGECGLL